MAKQNFRYYVVWKGRNTGVFRSWAECKEQIEGFPMASYKGYRNIDEAEDAFKFGKKSDVKSTCFDRPRHRAIAVDAACSGNPGRMEYRGVWSDTGEEIFRSQVFPEGTNNIGEFLAIVHALALCKQHGWNFDIYSDSRNAMLWLKVGKCRTKLQHNTLNAPLFSLVERGERWIAQNSYTNRVFKWETEHWGEIPADFGRK